MSLKREFWFSLEIWLIRMLFKVARAVTLQSIQTMHFVSLLDMKMYTSGKGKPIKADTQNRILVGSYNDLPYLTMVIYTASCAVMLVQMFFWYNRREGGA